MTTAEPIELSLALDRAAGRRYPLGQQLVDELRRRVQAGSLGPGERLPPVRGLAASLNVTPETVAGAYKRLVEQGYQPLRAAIAGILREQRGLDVDESTVCVTSGCQQGIDLAAKVFVAAGDVVLVEQPSFLGALEAFRARGARVIGVPIEGDGLRVEALPALIQRYRPKLLYCMPTYQNPTGRSLSPEKRRALLRIAAAYDLPIVEDDSAGFIHLDQSAAPSSLKAGDHAGYVIHLGTFSKLIAAGLRLGWLVADPPVFEKLVAAKYASDLSSDALVQRAVYRLLADGALEAHLTHARTAYRERRDVLVDALRRPRALPP